MNKIDSLYDDRKNFCVIALTGYSGAGCSRLADYMANPKFYTLDEVRTIDSIKIEKHDQSKVNNNNTFFEGNRQQIHDTSSLDIFKRKYTICREFIEKNYKPYTVIKYSKVLWAMALKALAHKNRNIEGFKNGIKDLIKDSFSPSHTYRDKDYKGIEGKEPWRNQIPEFDYNALFSEFESLLNKDVEERTHLLSQMFDGESETVFSDFFEEINHHLFTTDYYCACFFYHRLGYRMRSGEEIDVPCDTVFDNLSKGIHSIERIYDVVKFITEIIRALRSPDEPFGEKKECRVVIDRLRTSLEARYLKERYSGFYLIAVHDEEYSNEHLKKKIFNCYGFDEAKKKAQSAILEYQFKSVLWLGKIENKNEDFEKGNFASPNIEQCVADAEIHISNNESVNVDSPYFRTMAEQWLKFACLILHPGLITPSAEERCMVVAYTAKFNSGCISRQVGAVITNSAHSIRTIGWNDVPFGQIPCSLRSIRYYEDVKPSVAYSEFEKGNLPYYEGENPNFPSKVKATRPYLNTADFINALNGLPASYCFKSFHNEFENKKNQVHTRSLHAEENAILQMARFGGFPLEDGIIYVTASPCELCCKKLYQIGVRKIVYIDEYPGISRQNIIAIGYRRPHLKQFQGAYGTTYFKLFQPLMPYKDELALRLSSIMPKQKEAKKPEDIIAEIEEKIKSLPDYVKSPEEKQEIINHLKNNPPVPGQPANN